jgi:KaiC/GvpD/RAD55 family RecA-like ATPase
LGLKPELPFAVPIGKFGTDTVMNRISEAQQELEGEAGGGAKRLVIDPVSALLDELNEDSRRKDVLKLAALLSRLSLTTLITAELNEAGVGVERYAAHGVIRLNYDKTGKKVNRSLRIMKMRETMHSMNVIPFEIGKHGIELKV